jgi:hypothetical protein
MDQEYENDSVIERRSKPRINCNYPAIIRGTDKYGKKFDENARVINLSGSGIYALLNRYIPNGSVLSVNIALPTGNLEWGTSKIATTGIVLRGKIHPNGFFGIAIKIQQCRFY